jgi:FkbH-like protein
MLPLLTKVSRSLARDDHLPLSARLAKGRRYLLSTALAPLHLRQCDRVGARARVIGRPRIVRLGTIEIGDDLVLNSTYAPCELVTEPEGRITIGNGAGINFGTLICAVRSVTIGDGVSIGPYSIISDAESPDGADAAPIVIEDRVWLAGRVTVRPGARIGAGSVITAGSVVAGEIPPGVVAGGHPARVLRRLEGAPTAEELSGAAPAPTLAAAPARATAEPVEPAAVPAAPGAVALRGVVLADFTIGDLAARLRDPADGPVMEVVENPFGAVMQSLLAGPRADASDFLVVWTRPEEVSPAFRRVLDHEGASDAELLADVDLFADAIVRGGQPYRMTFVPTWTLPAEHRGLGMLDARPGGAAWALTRMNQRLMERLAEARGVFVLDAQRWLLSAGRTPTASKGWYYGKIAFPADAMAEAARDLKGAVRGLQGQARKLLVLDLDDTLWGGIVGDLGWENLRLGGHDPEGEALRDFQHAIKRLTRRGIVLGIVSKNTESVALEAIDAHPEMVLRRTDFVGWRINWEDKARNIADLAAELNLGLQSVVFIDDNPVERARVREALPEVLVPEWPVDKLQYPRALSALRCFDVPAISQEDAERTRLYVSEQQRTALRQEVGSIEDFLAGLGCWVRAERLGGANVTRAAQLLNKTNQMNLSTRRLTDAELEAWAAAPGREFWVLSVGDKFGGAGITGLLGVEHEGAEQRIVDFVLSCRVMGRKVEEAMASLAVARAVRHGCGRVVADYRPTAKNKPCLDFWQRSGFAADAPADGAATTRFQWETARAYATPSHIALTVEG